MMLLLLSHNNFFNYILLIGVEFWSLICFWCLATVLFVSVSVIFFTLVADDLGDPLVHERPIHLYCTVRRVEDQRDTWALVSKRIKLSTLLWGTVRATASCILFGGKDSKCPTIQQDVSRLPSHCAKCEITNCSILLSPLTGYLFWGPTEPLVRVYHCTRKPLNSPSISIVQDRYRMTHATRVCCCKKMTIGRKTCSHTHYTSTQRSWESTYLHTC